MSYREKDLENTLAKLPKKPDAIARYLNRLGVKGYRCSGYACPISNYVKMEAAKIGVSLEVSTILSEVRVHNKGLLAEITDGVGGLLHNFDKGNYPEITLEAKNR